MGKKKPPPRWQEGRLELEVVLPADKTKGGQQESARLGFSWKVSATRRPTTRDWVQLESGEARNTLAILADILEDGEEFSARQTGDLAKSLTCAVKAWCWACLRDVDKTIDDHQYHRAFDEKAPDVLRQAKIGARRSIDDAIDTRGAAMAEAMVAVRAAVDALLAAAARPPRNRRRFPAHLRRRRLHRPPRKPRVRPGSWIDTGRYRPAVVLEMMPDPPHTMKLSYGDEVDEDYRPHICNWKSVRSRKRIPSLKDVYSPGDWIRHPYSGYGQILAVRNSTMDVDYRGRVAIVAPDASLARWEKVGDPGPVDLRPVSERFPPGTWIETDRSGKGVVLGIEHFKDIEKDILVVLFRNDLAHIVEPDIGKEGPAVWKLDRAAFDLNSPWGRRWSWWWMHKEIYNEPVCACCGYPNFGRGGRSYFRARECLICGYPDFGTGLEGEDVPLVLRLNGTWRHRNAWDFPDMDDPEVMLTEPSDREWEVYGYSMAEARRNYESRGHMLRSDDPGVMLMEKVADLRRSLVRLLEKRRVEPSGWNEEDGKVVVRIRQEIPVRLA